MSVAAVGGWLFGWSEAQIAGIASVGRPLASLAIRQGLGLGLSGNQIQQILSSLGVGIRRQNLQGMVRNARATLRSEQLAASYDLGAVPSMGHVPETEFGSMSGNYHKVNVTFSEVIDGERAESTMSIIIRTDEPITVQEAVARAKHTFDRMATSDNYQPRTFLYGEYGGIRKQVARSRR